METVLSPREMYALERAYFEAGNDSLALMERAARCLTEELEAEGCLGGLTFYTRRWNRLERGLDSLRGDLKRT